MWKSLNTIFYIVKQTVDSILLGYLEKALFFSCSEHGFAMRPFELFELGGVVVPRADYLFNYSCDSGHLRNNILSRAVEARSQHDY